MNKILHSLWLLLLSVTIGWAQSGTYGNTHISAGGEMSIINVQHNFQNGGNGTQPGIVTTQRTTPKGYVSFVGTATHTGASNATHVDGYVRTYETTSFTFPIGDNGKLRTASVSTSSSSVPTDAAYYAVNPTTDAYPSTSVMPGVTGVSTVEYWDINGTTSAQITLTWDANSGVQSASNVKIVGWDGSQWVAIPSTVGGGATNSSGTVTTTNPVTPNTYTVYTLAGLTLSPISFTGSGPGVSTGNPQVSATTGEAKTGNAATELVPTGGNAPYVYSNGSSDAGCVAPLGALPLPASSNFTVTSSTGAYSYTAPSTPGMYYYCVKVCDSSTPTPVCKVAVYTVTVNSPVGVGTVDCAKTSIIPAPKAGTPSQVTLVVTVNVTTAGQFPVVATGSGMSLANGVNSVTTTTMGVQTFTIPLNYDGTALGTLNFTVGSSSCTANLSSPTGIKKVQTEVWSLDNCTNKVAAPVLK